MRFRYLLSVLALLLVSAPSAARDRQHTSYQGPAPQTDSQMSAPAHVAVIDGVASIERDGRIEPATASLPLVPGDRVKTAEGRVEVILTDGSVLDLDRHTAVDYLSETLIRLLEGRVFLTVAALHQGTEFTLYRIDAPGGAVRITAPGEFRVSSVAGPGGSEVELAVLRGSAEVSGTAGVMPVTAGERSVMRETGTPGFPLRFNSAMWDAFDRWVAMRRDARTGSRSARHLPQEVRAYSGAFDRYGAWREDPAYGAVWYPYASATWRPYSNGNWRHYPAFGWTWVGFDAWTWPTHHYGRWGHAGGSWFWIPAARWAPAWVHWAIAPGYIGWCPLGYDNRPLVNVNAFGHDRYRVGADHYAARGAYDPYSLWTFVSQHGFRGGALVRRHMVDARTFDTSVRAAVVTQAVAPGEREYAVPRGLTAPRTRVGAAPNASGTPPAAPGPSVGPDPSRITPAPEPIRAPIPGRADAVPRAPARGHTPNGRSGEYTTDREIPGATTVPDARDGDAPRPRFGAPGALRPVPQPMPAPQTDPALTPAPAPSYGRGIAVPRGSAGMPQAAPLPSAAPPPPSGGHSRVGIAVPRGSHGVPPPSLPAPSPAPSPAPTPAPAPAPAPELAPAPPSPQ